MMFGAYPRKRFDIPTGKTMKRYTRFLKNTFAIGALSAAISQHSAAEDLLEVYQKALDNDHTFRAAEAAYNAGRENKAIARANLLPSINASASWTDTSNEAIDSDPGADPFPTTTDTISSGYSISLDQPLFDMGAWARFKSGAANSDVASAQFESDKQNLIIRAAEAYFDTLLAVDTLTTALAEENALSHQLEQTKQRFEVGLTAITEVHEAQAVYDSAVADRLLAEGQVSIAFEALEVITGESYEFVSPLKADFPVALPAPAAREDWVERALANNYQLKVASARSEAARQDSKAAFSGHLPRLTGSLSYSDNNRDSETTYLSEVVSMSDVDTEGQSIGLTLTVPIYNGGGTSASRRQAKQRAIQARENYLQTQRDIVQQVRSLHLSVETSVATVKARRQAITSSESALEATQAGYEVGTRDLVDVLNAQRNLFRAKRNYYDALYRYIINSLQLKSAAGVLQEEGLQELNVWLDNENPAYKTRS
jgi:outer membrane protein